MHNLSENFNEKHTIQYYLPFTMIFFISYLHIQTDAFVCYKDAYNFTQNGSFITVLSIWAMNINSIPNVFCVIISHRYDVNKQIVLKMCRGESPALFDYDLLIIGD